MIHAWLRKIFKSQYVAYLESELERMRTERNAAVDALLVSRNLPTLTPHEPRPLPRTAGKMLPSQMIRKFERASAFKGKSDAPTA